MKIFFLSCSSFCSFPCHFWKLLQNRCQCVGPLYFKFNLMPSSIEPAHISPPVCTLCSCLNPSFVPACSGKLFQMVDLNAKSCLDANCLFCGENLTHMKVIFVCLFRCCQGLFHLCVGVCVCSLQPSEPNLTVNADRESTRELGF